MTHGKNWLFALGLLLGLAVASAADEPCGCNSGSGFGGPTCIGGPCGKGQDPYKPNQPEHFNYFHAFPDYIRFLTNPTCSGEPNSMQSCCSGECDTSGCRRHAANPDLATQVRCGGFCGENGICGGGGSCGGGSHCGCGKPDCGPGHFCCGGCHKSGCPCCSGAKFDDDGAMIVHEDGVALDCHGDSMCGSCDGCCCRSLQIMSGLETFRDPCDGTSQNNFGAVTGINFATRLPDEWGERGWGLQVGGTGGFYDWDGRSNSTSSLGQTQGFFTYGVFRRATACRPWSYGVVNDWTLNDHFGVNAQSPTLNQIRGVVAFTLSDEYEIGCWATLRGKGDSKAVVRGQTVVDYRVVNQANLFIHRHWEQGAETYFWGGVVQRNRLSGAASLGDFTLGGMMTVPLSDRVASYCNAQYMRPSAKPGAAAAVDSIWDMSFGLVFYLNGCSRACNVNGNCCSPLLSVANNGSMMVDCNTRTIGAVQVP